MADDDLPEIVERLVEQADTLLDNHDNISQIVKHLDIPFDALSDQYDQPQSSTRFGFAPIVRTFLYRELCDYSDSELAGRLDTWPYLTQRFGFSPDEGSPTQGGLSYMWRNRLGLDTRRVINQTAEAIQSLAADRDIRLTEVAPPAPDPDDVTDGDDELEPVHHFVDRNVGQFMDLARDTVFTAFDTGRANNTKHADDRVWYSQTKASFLGERSGTRVAFRSLNRQYGDKETDVLHNDTHTRAVKKLATPETHQYELSDYVETDGTPTPPWRRIANTIQDQYADAVDGFVDAVRNTGMFQEPAVAAIDITHDQFHVSPWKSEDEIEPDDERIVVNDAGKTKVPKDDYPEMVEGMKGGHEYGYAYATLTIVGNNVPLVLAVEPVRHNSIWEGDDGESVSYAEIVDRLLEQALEHVDLHMVMVDRGFDAHGVQDVIDSHDLTYLIPKQKYERDLDGIEKVRNHEVADIAVEPDVTLGTGADTGTNEAREHEVQFMYVPAQTEDFEVVDDRPTSNGEGGGSCEDTEEMSYAVFMTNRDDVSPDEAMGLIGRYERRWDIENAYKSISRFLPSIASTDFRMRCFSFMFATLLYNVWRLTDYTMKVLVYEKYDGYGPEEGRLRPRPEISANGCIDSMLNCLPPPY
ncbi:transposase [Halocalculus aciditolerans]|uniref:Transposase IS4-like domain-containing protein n=1 Tax=Halocalculus aciditolerans TaxID=1383812 RepID=A0A830FEG6_9EURY|nr:transposase [Halocalculus aciditolerans]GGL67050.1 hypothetical protein GCM10009039_26310 [Halocalculus aciditolerans]